MNNPRDVELHRVWVITKTRSLIRNLRLRIIQDNCLLASNIPGDVIEVGCLEGGTTKALAEFLPHKNVYAIDTFEGFPVEQLGEEEKWLEGGGKLPNMYEDTVEYLKNNGNVRVIKGTFPDCITQEMISAKWSVVNLDTDTYVGILSGLKFFWERMSIGGIMHIDDWFRPELPGVAKAIEEFFGTRPDSEYRAVYYGLGLYWGCFTKLL